MSAFGSSYTPYPPIQNGKEKRGGLLLPADYARIITVAERASLTLLASPPRARVFRSTDQSIASGAFTAISFDTVQENDGGGAGGALPWNGTTPTRLTAPNGGLYAIGGAALWAATAGGTRRGVSLRLNGATFINLPQVGNPAGAFLPSLVPVTTYRLAAADYIELVVIQDSGGAVLVSTAANYSPVLWFWRICA